MNKNKKNTTYLTTDLADYAIFYDFIKSLDVSDMEGI